jgi:VWFA-related protein
MNRTFLFFVGAVITPVLTGGSYAANDRQAGETVSVSAVVLDKAGLPMRNLRASDFTLREDGKPVTVISFTATNAAETSSAGRSMVLVLGGQGGDPELTLRYQKIAQKFFARAKDRDTVSVVRMKDDHDEVGGSRSDMQMRLAEFRAPYGEPFNAKTGETILRRIARISDDLPDTNPGRKAIVCIGPSYVFDIREPQQREYELEWPYWVKALNATARANVSIYVIDPKGLDYRTTLNPDGLVNQTGGALVENSNDFEDAVERVWQETGAYYTLEYVSAGTRRELHSIEVKTSAQNSKVRARRSR